MFNPAEVTPELNADVGIKKGEKVDYAILRDGRPVILFECKHHATDLGKVHASQLYRYFSVTEARFGVLTNGVQYWFYTDLEAPNKMDARPFFEFNMLDVRESAVEELKKFTKSAFDLTNILTTAAELKYTREIRRIMAEQLQEPSDEFVKFFASQVYTGKLTQAVRSQFAPLIRQGLRSFINDQINERLKTALTNEPAPAAPPADAAPPAPANGASAAPEPPGVVTTDDEREAFLVVKAIVRDIVDVRRVAMRDVQSYCGILLDDNNRKPICRLHFNGAQKYVGFIDGLRESGKDGQREVRVPIEQIDDLYLHADRLRAAVARLDVKPARAKP